MAYGPPASFAQLVTGLAIFKNCAKIQTFALAHRGLVREVNEDRHYVQCLDADSLLLAVRDIMIRGNRRAKQDTQSGMFIALLYAHLNPVARTVTLCSAGQTQPILCAAADRRAQLVETRGDTFPLGIIAEVDYQETNLQMAPGDCLILYTDGIVEAENENGEMLGFERLLDIVAQTNDAGADQILKTIIDEVNRFVGAAP